MFIQIDIFTINQLEIILFFTETFSTLTFKELKFLI